LQVNGRTRVHHDQQLLDLNFQCSNSLSRQIEYVEVFESAVKPLYVISLQVSFIFLVRWGPRTWSYIRLIVPWSVGFLQRQAFGILGSGRVFPVRSFLVTKTRKVVRSFSNV